MLHLNKVILSNFYRHPYLEVDIRPGLMGVFGRNGIGKTALANAICGALTGTFNRHVDGYTGCIRQNQPDPAYVEVHGDISGVPFRLRRDLTPKTLKHNLWVGDQRYSKAKDIESWITEASGLTPQVMSEFMFIEQQDMYSFLTATDAERSKTFAALCGTRQYDHIRDEYTELLRQDKTKFDLVGTMSEEFLKTAIQDAQNNLDSIDNVLDNVKAQLDKTMSEAELKKLRDKVTDLTAAIQQADKSKALVQTARQSLQATQDRCERVKANVLESNSVLKTLADSLVSEEAQEGQAMKRMATLLDGRDFNECMDHLQKLQASREQRRVLEEKLAQAKTRLQNMPDSDPVVLQEAQQNVAKYQDVLDATKIEIVRLDTNITSLNTLVNALKRLHKSQDARLTKCPLCGADHRHWTVELDKAVQQYDELFDARDKQIERQNEAARYVDRYTQAITLQEQLAQKHAEASERVRDFEQYLVAYADDDVQLIEQYQAIKKADDAWAVIDRDLQRTRSTIEREEQIQAQRGNELRLAEQDVVKGQEQLNAAQDAAAKYSEEYIESTQKQIDELSRKIRSEQETIQQIQTQIAELEGSRKEAIRQTQNLEKQLRDQQALKINAEQTRLWFEKCSLALDWFKKDGLPRLIHRSILGRLVSVINDNLKLFDEPFTVSVNDNLTFTALFNDGCMINSKSLSGGQKVMLALSFWSAINRTFAQNLGIMILDEPTDGLDSQNSAKMHDVLDQWKKLLHSRKQQVLIITHDDSLENVFDSSICLT